MKVSDEQARYLREELDITGTELRDLLDDREELLRLNSEWTEVMANQALRIEKLERVMAAARAFLNATEDNGPTTILRLREAVEQQA